MKQKKNSLVSTAESTCREAQLLMEDVSKTCVASVIVVPLASREEKEEFYHIKS